MGSVSGWRRLVVALVTAALLLGPACTAGGDTERADTPAIRVASFDFDESELIAELYAQVLERVDLPVRRLGRIGPREILAPAIELGQVDVVPEYLGTASGYFGIDLGRTGMAGPQALSPRLEARGLRFLQPSRAQDVNVVVVARSTAETFDLRVVSDLTPIASLSRFGGPVECPDRPLCLPGLEGTYGLVFAEFVPQRTLDRTAEALRRREIEVGLMFSTSAHLESDDLVVLIDDQSLQPPENIVPLVSVAALGRWPALEEALNRVSAELTTAAVRRMNGRVADGEPIGDVAAEWLDEVEAAAN